MRTITLIALLLLSFSARPALAQEASEGVPRTAAPAEAVAYIQAPADGAEVSSPFIVRFGLRGMGVAPAGITAPNTGHHHLLIDVATLPPENLPLPAIENEVVHFGTGATEAEIDLPPGEHTLQLVLGDALHIPHDPPVRSDRITITVVE